jgi:hypothetical protein
MFARDVPARKGCQMRYRATFLAGFAAGFVAGTRAGRERYEQIKQLGRKAADSPAVRQATRVASEKATEFSKVARERATARMPRLTETARSGASRMRGRLDRIPGLHSEHGEAATVNGTRPTD